ncbi:MAG: hypothetical protein K8S24_06185 [Candidatus Aegiribacteria sp.]|nr:hypothetical protein [Candidatus Aegiribacteria sp.]
MLTFARGGTPVRKTISIEEILRDSAEFALRGSDVRCEFSIDDNLWFVDADEEQIGQVVNNLIINTDQAIPGSMRGQETLRRLLVMDPEVKAIVFSGYSNDPVMSNYADYGFRGVVAKLYSFEELCEAVHNVITDQE